MALKGKKILFLDDELSMGEIMQLTAERHGAELTHFARARIHDDKLVLMSPEGKETVLATGDFDFALVDGRIKGGSVHGWDVTPYMVKLGLPVVAVSGADSINEQMIAVGATKAVRKDKLWDAFRDGTFSV